MLSAYNPNKNWEAVKEEFLEREKRFKELNSNIKVYCFLRHTLLPRYMYEKFPYVIRNNKWNKPQASNPFIFSLKELSPHNAFVVRLILRGFIILFMALYHHSIVIFEELEEKNRFKLHTSLYNFSVFNFFNNFYQDQYFFNNDILLDFVIGYVFDKNNISTFVDYFNFNLLRDLKSIELLLNFENYKYEEDCIRYGPKKAEKLYMDIFELDYLDFNDTIFFSFCIYEFYVYFNDYDFNFFNFDFFNRIFVMEQYFEYHTFETNYQNIKDLLSRNFIYNKKKAQSFLTSVYFDYDLEFLQLYKKKKRNNIIFKQRSLLNYKTNNFIKNQNNFDFSKHILNIKDFGIRIPHLFFLLFTWYSIYYRRMRYNYYIMSHEFYQEYPSRMYYFISINNPFGKNRTKMAMFKHQKLLTLLHLSNFVENKTLNDWFYFYEMDNVKFNYVIYNNLILNKFMFNNILTNKKFINFFETIFNFDYYKAFQISNLIFDESNFINFYGYTLLMETATTKFTKHFRLARLGYFELYPMIETIFSLSYDQHYIKYRLKMDLLANFLYDNYKKFHNFYFLMDFYNIKEKKTTIIRYNILKFFDKIINLVFFLIDPFFFKFYWRRCFPNKWYRFWHLHDFVWEHMVLIDMEDILVDYDLKIYDFICYFLQWRIETSSFSIVASVNSAATERINYIFIMINMLYRNRLIYLLEQIRLILRIKEVKNISSKLYILFILKNYYFNLLMCNFDFILLIFFKNINNYKKMLYNNFYKFNRDIIYSDFRNRHYVFEPLLETHFYHDWFYDWMKRILWIYKNPHNHEGLYFYSYKKKPN